MVKKVTDPWTEPFKQLRRELGLAPVINPLFEGQFSPYATLALYSRWMGDLQPDHPVNCDITGFAYYDTPPGAPTQLPEDLKRFLAEGPPPLVFTRNSIGLGEDWRAFHLSRMASMFFSSRRRFGSEHNCSRVCWSYSGRSVVSV